MQRTAGSRAAPFSGREASGTRLATLFIHEAHVLPIPLYLCSGHMLGYLEKHSAERNTCERVWERAQTLGFEIRPRTQRARPAWRPSDWMSLFLSWTSPALALRSDGATTFMLSADLPQRSGPCRACLTTIISHFR
jgi:hypothetical protein